MFLRKKIPALYGWGFFFRIGGFMKKLQIRIVAIILSLLIATTLLYHPVKVKAAVVAAPTAMQITSFILSVTGAVDLLTGGGVTKVSGTIRDALATKVSELMGTGIYTDSNGDYVFSSSATKDIYSILNQDNSGTRVISSFQGLTPMAGLLYFGNPFVDNSSRNWIDDNRTLYSSYLCVLTPKYWWNNSGDQYRYNVQYIDISNVAYFIPTTASPSGLYFYDKYGSNISVSARRIMFYNASSSNGGPRTVDLGTKNINYLPWYEGSGTDSNWNTSEVRYPGYRIFFGNYLNENDIPVSSYNTFVFTDFPYFGSNGGSIIWSNRSLLVGRESSETYTQYKFPSGIQVANNYNQLPTISPDVITNNSWDKIYNDYVTNVSNNVQYFYNTETNQYNYDEMYKYIKSFNNNITNEVDSGSTDIEQNIEYNNTWLSMIYDTLRSISVKLDNLSSGGGGSSCPWTETDIQNMLSSLSRLENSLSQDVTTNQQIFAYLATLNQSILSIASSNNPQTIYNEYNNYYAALNGLPDADVLDFIGKTDVIKALLPTVAPFGFIALGSAIISGLAAEPVDPVFVMPLQFNHSLVGQTVNIDEEITIDLTPFNSARIVLNAFLVLAFLLSLIFITIELIHRFIAILGG